MTKHASRRELLIGAGAAVATGMMASGVPVAAETGSQPAPARPNGGGPFVQSGHAGTQEVIDEQAVVVYHRDTGEVMHVHLSTTLKGGTIPTQDELAERSLKCAIRAAEEHNHRAKAAGKRDLLMQRDPETLRVAHTHPDRLRQGPIRVDPSRGEVIPID